MCGIVGVIGNGVLSPSLIEKMNFVQNHRGPDEAGYFHSEKDNVYIAMARLSIIDIEGGSQPMTTSDGRYTIVFNGEIFNAKELRLALENEGIQFKSNHSDTEVILLLFQRFGSGSIDMLNGMFAFTIYDSLERTIFLGRDYCGIKPLHYFHENEIFAFASEIKSLKCIDGAANELDLESINHFFSLNYIPTSNTIYKKIKKIPAGHYLIYDIEKNSVTIKRYWLPRFGNIKFDSRDELIKEIYKKLTQAVIRWSTSDVDICVSLSGGIDSAIILKILSENSNSKISTFTLGFKDAGSEVSSNEYDLARITADKFKANQCEIQINSMDLLGEIKEIIASLDEPYGGGIPSWFVYKAMSLDGFKVAMSGTGADEIFGGYGKWIPFENLALKIKTLVNRWRSGYSIGEIFKYTNGVLYYPNFYGAVFKKKILFKHKLIDKIIPTSKFINNELAGWKDPIDDICKFDIQNQLAEEFLMMSDRFSMAHSVELRTPFLDKEFIEFIFSLDSSYRKNYKKYKQLLIDAVANHLPREIISSSKKGFVLPRKEWLYGALKDDLMKYSSPTFLKEQALFNTNFRKSVIEPFLNGKDALLEIVWSWWMFQRWYEHNH